jgi:CubicO group peptidase (beta-lactamase class C family)
LLADLNAKLGVRQIPGMSIRAVQNGVELFRGEFGFSNLASSTPLSPIHAFRVGSLTKPILAHAVLQLAKQGRLDWNDSITSYLPELARRPDFRIITISHLLSHTAGLARGPYSEVFESAQDILRQIACSNLLFHAGDHFKYSNWAYFLLGLVIERTSGDAAHTFLERQILSPLGMCRSELSGFQSGLRSDLTTGYWDGWLFGSPNLTEPSVPSPPISMPDCAAGMVSTSDDYLRWLMSLVGPRESHRLIDRDIVEQMLLPRHKLSANRHCCFGLFVETSGESNMYYCAGSASGFSGFVLVIPEASLAAVALCNHGARTSELRAILYQVCRERLGGLRLPHFERRGDSFNVMAGNRKSFIHLKSEEGMEATFLRDGRQVEVLADSPRAYWTFDGDGRGQALRIRSLKKGDSVLTLGSEVFYEDFRRLRRRPKPVPFWEETAGTYRHPAVGTAEVLDREGNLYLSFGIKYETLLQHLDGLRFQQQSGPFRLETVEFQRDPAVGTVVSFVLNGMLFYRETTSVNDERQTKGGVHE